MDACQSCLRLASNHAKWTSLQQSVPKRLRRNHNHQEGLSDFVLMGFTLPILRQLIVGTELTNTDSMLTNTDSNHEVIRHTAAEKMLILTFQTPF
jgi:hypothetical protein